MLATVPPGTDRVARCPFPSKVPGVSASRWVVVLNASAFSPVSLTESSAAGWAWVKGGLQSEESDMKTALVIVDMLRDFVDGRLANPAARPTIQRIGELADAARGRKDWIVVYGNDAHHPGDVELRLFGEHAMVGTPGAQVIDELTLQAGTSWCPSATTPRSARPTWRPPAWSTTSAGW
jgi:hypothetical protein